MLPGHFGPGGTLKMEAVLQSKEKEAGSCVTLWSGRMNPELLISALLLCEKIHHPVTSGQMQFLIYTPGLPPSLPGLSRPGFLLYLAAPMLLPLSPPPPASARFFENPGT